MKYKTHDKRLFSREELHDITQKRKAQPFYYPLSAMKEAISFNLYFLL